MTESELLQFYDTQAVELLPLESVWITDSPTVNYKNLTELRKIIYVRLMFGLDNLRDQYKIQDYKQKIYDIAEVCQPDPTLIRETFGMFINTPTGVR